MFSTLRAFEETKKKMASLICEVEGLLSESPKHTFFNLTTIKTNLMNDLSFLTGQLQDNGKHGIEALSSLITAANRTYDLFAAAYLDDKKIDVSDLNDAITLGPGVVAAIVSAARSSSRLGEEITDLSEAEKSQILALAGSRLNRPGYMKILKGMLEMTDGISELINADNPTD